MVTFIRRSISGSLFLFLFALTAGSRPARAQDVTCVFIAPSTSLVAGNRASVWLYCMNNSSNEVRKTFEPRLSAQLVSPAGTLMTVLELDPADAGKESTIAPGAFRKEQYFLNVPPAVLGTASLAISNYNQVDLRITGTSTATEHETTAPQSFAPASKPRRWAFQKFFDNHLSPYEPIYFLLGTYPAAEFQFSLKYQIFSLTNNYSVLDSLYFGYTQTSYWDLISSDPSFFDTSYKPSVFAYFPDLLSRHDQSIQLDLQGGAEHESNGRGGTMERSIYTAYLQPTVTFGKPGHLQLALQPRAWTYFLVGHNNPDIAAYRGYADLRAFVTLKKDPTSWKNFQIETRFRIGDGGAHPGIQIDGRYKVPLFFNPTFQVQYFEGYGQTLRQYNKEAHGLRVGLCLWYWPDYPASPDAK